MAVFSPLLDVLAEVPNPRRAQGQFYKLPRVLLFAILAIVTGCNSYRGVERERSPGMVTFIAVHRRRLNAAFGLNWRRTPAHTAIRYILQGLDLAEVENAFRHHAALLQAARATPGQGSIALDGKTLRCSFDKLRDCAAAQVLSAFATALVLAHIDVEPRGSPGIAEKSNGIPAAQALLAELGVADGTIVTLDALHCQKAGEVSYAEPVPGTTGRAYATRSRPIMPCAEAIHSQSDLLNAGTEHLVISPTMRGWLGR